MDKTDSVMKVVIAGSRGIPAAYGGFETFAEEIAIRLSQRGFNVTVICEKSEHSPDMLGAVKLIYSRFKKSENPVRFYHDSISRIPAGTDILLVCGVGGALFYPLLSGRKFRLITHVDGREELRGKFSAVKKLYVRLAQSFTARLSDHVIADSLAVRNHWIQNKKIAGSSISAIEFGANVLSGTSMRILEDLGLKQGDYFLVVCRMVPENNLEMILEGFRKSQSELKLVLVGDLTGNFGKSLLKQSSHKIIFSPSIYDKEALFSLRLNCFAYLHGHSVGGTNPSLLEAMSAGNICICHDNEFNRETTENNSFYFGTADDLSEKIREVIGLSESARGEYAERSRRRISGYYNWDRITEAYVQLFNKERAAL